MNEGEKGVMGVGWMEGEERDGDGLKEGDEWKGKGRGRMNEG